MTLQIRHKITGYSVVSPNQDAMVPSNIVLDDADRRLKLETVQIPIDEAMRWESRPEIAEGNPAHVFQIRGPEHRFFVIVSYIENGSPGTGYPFELLVSGNAPRGLNALAKSLSMDMRQRDRAWLKTKLESISKTRGTPFVMQAPNGNSMEMPSEVAAFAQVVLHQCEQLGAFSEDNLKYTPLMSALMSVRRPKTTPDGTVAWACDVHNQFTGDKFKLFVPELEFPDGSKRPFEVWFDGDFPDQTFRGLAKCLSLDLQINDLAWVERKLRQLTTIEESQGAFFAQVPGTDKTASYPSTIAYVATLILHRFKVLGLIDDSAVKQSTKLSVISNTPSTSAQARQVSGITCPDCKTVGKVKVDDGCQQCLECGWSRCG